MSIALGLPVLGALVLSLRTNDFLPLTICVFVEIVLCILLLKPQSLVNYFLMFGYFFFPGNLGKIGGLVTLNWLRISVLAILFTLLSVVTMKHFRIRKGSYIEYAFFLTSMPWIFYIGLTIFWAISPLDAMRYYPKLFFCLAVSMALLLMEDIRTQDAVRYLLVGGLMFAIAATPFKVEQWNTSDVAWFTGVFGRHSPKFALTFIVMFSLTTAMSRIHRRLSLTTFILSLAWLSLLLQRGAMLALAFGGIALWILSMDKIKFSRLVQAAVFAMFVGMLSFTMLYNSSFSTYMFVPHRGPHDLFMALLSGDFQGAVDVINFKGRLEMWGYAMQLGVSFLGAGMGSSAYYMRGMFGRIYEIHNDHLAYLLDGGLLGYSLFWLMWVGMAGMAWHYRKSVDNLTRTLAILMGAYGAGLFIWSIVDHVISYADASIAYLYILAALLVKRQRELGSTIPRTETIEA
ncbi:MAG: hypothetical protein KDC10_08100 [Calditrichaeota bacterium]|nr:hypothetical protein [Candidatus Cloacimonadota bacterium]MCA9784966.1 hypothetical protein [Candidatus Cloacimonadota bacterium]MCB1047154.1 hypothetical protein [Calditrichota bacterium]MCB9472579.1 hypothetical protein [Candidatus Delongbacteria bacterium]